MGKLSYVWQQMRCTQHPTDAVAASAQQKNEPVNTPLTVYDAITAPLKEEHADELASQKQQHADELASEKQKHADERASEKQKHDDELASEKQKHADERASQTQKLADQEALNKRRRNDDDDANIGTIFEQEFQYVGTRPKKERLSLYKAFHPDRLALLMPRLSNLVTRHMNTWDKN
jgi:hypothetical protein